MRELESHWVPHSYNIVPNLSKKRKKKKKEEKFFVVNYYLTKPNLGYGSKKNVLLALKIGIQNSVGKYTII